MADYSLIVENIFKSYKNGGKENNCVLNDVTLMVKTGEFVCVLGKSGCGKSTLLNLLAGYIKPDKGCILVNGRLVEGPAQDRGVIFQEHALFPWYTVFQNISFGPVVNKRPNAREIALKYLRMIGLEEYKDYYPDQLSGGMKQRVGIARAFANNPKILLMDEPFSALDPNTRTGMQNELLQIWADNKTTVVFITHNVREAIYLADRVVVLGRGIVKANEAIALERPRDAHSEEFNKYVAYFEELLGAEETAKEMIE